MPNQLQFLWSNYILYFCAPFFSYAPNGNVKHQDNPTVEKNPAF